MCCTVAESVVTGVAMGVADALELCGGMGCDTDDGGAANVGAGSCIVAAGDAGGDASGATNPATPCAPDTGPADGSAMIAGDGRGLCAGCVCTPRRRPPDTATAAPQLWTSRRSRSGWPTAHTRTTARIMGAAATSFFSFFGRFSVSTSRSPDTLSTIANVSPLFAQHSPQACPSSTLYNHVLAIHSLPFTHSLPFSLPPSTVPSSNIPSKLLIRKSGISSNLPTTH